MRCGGHPVSGTVAPEHMTKRGSKAFVHEAVSKRINAAAEVANEMN